MIRNPLIPQGLFSDKNYYQYIVQYQGDIMKEILPQSGYYVVPINETYAILLSTKDEIDIDIKNPAFSSIVYVKPSEVFTLEEVSPVEVTQVNFIQSKTELNLLGDGVNVAIVDSGIDYLSEEFIYTDGKTRIDCIWDQTIISNGEKEFMTVPYGAVYTRDKIQQAIDANKAGKSAYDIVPTKDEIGHGTKMASIIGATGKNPVIKGIAPKCEFVVIKLLEDKTNEARFESKVPVYNITSIFTALEFLYEYSLINQKPMVVYLPLQSTLGNHKGNSILEEYIDSIVSEINLAVVCGSGNQGSNGTHTSGLITEVGGIAAIELIVSPAQKSIIMEIWVELPNIMTVDVISPSGENTGGIPFLFNSVENYKFTFETTKVKVSYYMPEVNSGDELIRVTIDDLQPGMWRVILTGKAILSGRFDAWILPEGVTKEGTRFNKSDYYGTITSPASSTATITAAAYNQNNNNILNYSGRAFATNYANIIDVAVGGVNMVTVGPNNEVVVVNGTSVSAAILTGVCAILFEWGIVKGNQPLMYYETIKAYLAKGTNRRSGDTYPNPFWGYGILNVYKLFQNM